VPPRPEPKVHLPSVGGSGGVVWSASPEGFHANLVALDPGGAMGAHRNDSVDVLVVVLAGTGIVTIGDEPTEVADGDALVVPRGAVRSTSAGPSGLRYLSVHAARPPMGIGRRPDSGPPPDTTEAS
jgi:quercetin dioxygenase-like cupin family protein